MLIDQLAQLLSKLSSFHELEIALYKSQVVKETLLPKVITDVAN